MKNLSTFLMALIILSSKSLMASDLQVSMDEHEVKEEVARSLGLNAQQIEIAPAAIEYVQTDKMNSQGVNIKGRLFITWSVRDIFANDQSMSFTKNDVSYKSNTAPSLDGADEDKILNSVKIGYQFFEHLGVETSYEKNSSTMDIASIASGGVLGSVSNALPTKIQNDFQTIKIGLVTNANLINAKSFRMDIVAGANAGAIMLNSTYNNKGDVYDGAFGYNYGAEAGIKVIHKSGFFFGTGVGVNNKVLAPMTHKDGSQSEYNGSEKFVFVNVGYSFGGKKRR